MEGRLVRSLLVASAATFALAILLAAHLRDPADIVIWACGIGSVGLLVSAVAVAIAANLAKSPRG